MCQINNLGKIEQKRKWLSRKIYITRKSRIQTSERIKRENQFYQFINVYYSLFIVGLSIISLIYIKNDSQLFSTLLLVASIMLTMFSLLYASKNHVERYLLTKSSYIRLDYLYNQIEYVESKSLTIEFLDDIHNKYNEELDKVENHTDIDYLRAKRTIDGEVFTFYDNIKFYYYIAIELVNKLFLLILPVIFFVAYCLYKQDFLSLIS